MKRPTEGEIERAVAALIPFAQEWRLPLNPEDLQAMAVAVLTHTWSDETLDEIDAAERQWIEEHRPTLPPSPSDPLSEAELAIIERRAAAATPGPWTSFVEGRDHDSGDDFIRTGGIDEPGPDLYLRHDSPGVPAAIADQDFIAHARQDVPRLVAEVRRLRELIRAGAGGG